MSNEINIKLYPDAYITLDGIEIVVDVNDCYDDSHETTKSWSKIVDELFEMHKIPYQNDSRTIIPFDGTYNNSINEIYESLLALETVALKIRRRLEECYVLDHTTWKQMGEKEPHIRKFSYDYVFASAKHNEEE